MHPLLKGLIFGFSIAVPVGPIGMLCLQRSLSRGRLVGLVSGLGAATADAMFGLVAALGLTAITTVLLEYRSWLQFGGGVFLVCLGVATFRTKSAPSAAADGNRLSLVGAFGSTLALTLTNPMTVLSFLGVFAGLGVGSSGGIPAACWLVLGVFLGSAVWWVLLSAAAGWVGQRVKHGGLRGFNLVSGCFIAGFGAWQLVALLQSLR